MSDRLMDADALFRKMLDLVQAATFTTNADEEFVSIGLAMLSLAISRLSPADREEALTAIEEGNALRKAVGLFPGARQTQEVNSGTRH